MRFLIVLVVLSLSCGARGAESVRTVVSDERGAVPQERPKMKATTPAVLFLSSAVVTGCFVWLGKHCGHKIYRHIVRRHWREKDWREYVLFIRRVLLRQPSHPQVYRKNPYQVLGLGNDARASDIKKTYRDLARRYHPDKNPGDRVAEEKFKEIAAAYGELRGQGRVR